MSPTAINPLDHIAIQNVLARYCHALDTKDWVLLKKVFTQDVKADYPFNHNLQGAVAVADAIQKRLGPIVTHHAITTFYITFAPDARRAQATTYFVGSHFGQGPHEGKVLQAYGRYVDELEVQGNEAGEDKDGAGAGVYEGVPGASGAWGIVRREVSFMKRIGDERIMKEF